MVKCTKKIKFTYKCINVNEDRSYKNNKNDSFCFHIEIPLPSLFHNYNTSSEI